MKQIFRKSAALLTALTMTSGISVTTWAAENSNFDLQINGETVVFDDLKPINRNNRIFVPFRDTMEAMGAEVSYDNATHTTTAVRGDTTIQFRPGETAVTVIENGMEKNLETSMVISSGNAYVPIRFLGEVFQYPVGWDSTEKTALLIDTDAALAESGSFSLMNRYLEYSNTYNTQPYAFKGTFSFNIDMPYDETTAAIMPITGTGTLEGISESDKQNMSAALQLDITKLKNYIATQSPDEASATMANSIVSALENVEFDYIIDIPSGKMYLHSPLFTFMGMPQDAWFLIDLDEMYASMGMNISLAELMETMKAADFESYLKASLASIPLTSVNDYAAFKESISIFTTLFSDEAFQKQADGYVSQFEFNDNATNVSMVMKLLETNGAISGYNLDLSAGESGTNYITLSLSQSNDAVFGEFQFNMPDMLTMGFDYNMTMEPTTQKALSQPDSSNIIDMMEIADYTETIVTENIAETTPVSESTVADTVSDSNADASADNVSDSNTNTSADSISDSNTDASADNVSDSNTDASADNVSDNNADASADNVSDSNTNTSADSVSDNNVNASADDSADNATETAAV